MSFLERIQSLEAELPGRPRRSAADDSVGAPRLAHRARANTPHSRGLNARAHPGVTQCDPREPRADGETVHLCATCCASHGALHRGRRSPRALWIHGEPALVMHPTAPRTTIRTSSRALPPARTGRAVEEQRRVAEAIASRFTGALRELRDVLLPPNSSTRGDARPRSVFAPVDLRRVDPALWVTNQDLAGARPDSDLRHTPLLTAAQARALSRPRCAERRAAELVRIRAPGF